MPTINDLIPIYAIKKNHVVDVHRFSEDISYVKREYGNIEAIPENLDSIILTEKFHVKVILEGLKECL